MVKKSKKIVRKCEKYGRIVIPEETEREGKEYWESLLGKSEGLASMVIVDSGVSF